MNIIGTGTGSSQNQFKVADDGRGLVESNSLIRAAYVSQQEKQLWSWRGVGNFDAGDTWLFIANTSTSMSLYIQKIFGYADVAGLVTVHLPAYPTIAGTAVTAERLHNNTTAGQPPVDARQDETGNTQANIIYQTYIANNGTYDIDVNGMVILGYRECIAIDHSTDAGATTFAHIWGWME